ncbi:glycosyltransferase [Immundisolibacter cernigliae]|uniref:glycosyltransferase n=1 Tax=Immundisolibacter cernigliae TaxID=1810504 RepID=UPI00096AD199
MENALIKVTALVVTHNRPRLLREVIDALWMQSRKPDSILVIDNCSDSETGALLETLKEASLIPFSALTTERNLGGAGGFAFGMAAVGYRKGHYVWVMDDDACPSATCLETLLELAIDENRVIGPAAVGHPPDDSTFCWAVEAVAGRETFREREHCGGPLRVSSLPFLGLLIPTSLLDRVAPPRPELFISGDDVEFCIRCKKAGVSIWLAPSATLYHPLPRLRRIALLGKVMWIQELPAWKRYFEVRNRIWVASHHYGRTASLLVAMGTVIRWVAAMIFMPHRLEQSRAFLQGVWDALFNNLDNRPFGPN